MPGTAAKPAAPGHETLAAAYLEAAENLIHGQPDAAKDRLKRIVEKHRHQWMDPVYIAAEVDYAKLLKAESRKTKKKHDDRSP
jgi:hypothetical protein